MPHLYLRRSNFISEVFYCFSLHLTGDRQVLICIYIFKMFLIFHILNIPLKLPSPKPVLKTPRSPIFQLIQQTETCISPYSCAVNCSDELFICHSNSYFSNPVKTCQSI